MPRASRRSAFVAIAMTLGRLQLSAQERHATTRLCEDFWKASAVFVGDVRSIVDTDDPDRLAVTFTVVEPLYRITESDATLVTPRPNERCGWAFETGRRYIVYADRGDGVRQTTDLCGRTRPIEDADGDVVYARSMQNLRPTHSTVTGWVTRTASLADPTAGAGPVANIGVTLDGADASRVWTNENGRFEILTLPGEHAISVAAPPGYLVDVKPSRLSIPDPRACAIVIVTLKPAQVSRGR